MKRRWLSLCFVMMGFFTIGLAMPNGDAQAYFTDNPNKTENGKTVHKQCFTMQWLGKAEYGDTSKADESKGQNGNIDYTAYATKWFCTYPDNKGKSSSITAGNGVAISGATLVGNRVDGSDGVVISVIEGGKGIRATTWQGKAPTGSKDFMLADNNNDFKQLTDSLSGWLPSTLNVGVGISTEKYTENKKLTGEVLNEMEKKAEEAKYGTSNNDYGGSICYNESGNLGWVFCPLIEGVGKAMSQLYDEIIQPFLVIEPGLISGDGTYTAWDIFRNFANIAFVILFLVVIFSQLTGVGIDNYGIKRMLPKLIVAAILINLSYVICQLAVDLSNILGNSLESLFNGIAAQINEKSVSPAEYFSGLVSTVGSAIGLASLGGTALVELAPLANLGFAAIVPILLGLLAAIISVLFMFVILFVRKAIAILLVAVAPVAFVAYIMPNTKRIIFDKWLSMFKGVLAVYPLAGALVGGGVLASSIIVAATADQVSSGNASLGLFLLYMGALLLQVVPFFFLPRLFRSSLRDVGNLGSAIANRGARFSERARNAVEGSERMQDWQNRQKENVAKGRADRTIRDMKRRMANGQDLTPGQRRRFARATNISDAIGQRRSKEDLIAANAFHDDVNMDGLLAMWDEAFDSNNERDLETLTNLLDQRYGAAAAGKIGERLARKTDMASNSNRQASMQTLRQTMTNNTNFAGNMRNKASDAFQMIQEGGRTYDENGRETGYANLDYFSENNGVSANARDWSTQSAATLQRAINTGKLKEEDIRGLLNSTDPSIQSGLLSDSGKRDVLQAAINHESSVGPNGPLTVAETAANYRAQEAARIEQEQQSQRVQQEQIARDLSEINRKLDGQSRDKNDVVVNIDGDSVSE